MWIFMFLGGVWLTLCAIVITTTLRQTTYVTFKIDVQMIFVWIIVLGLLFGAIGFFVWAAMGN